MRKRDLVGAVVALVVLTFGLAYWLTSALPASQGAAFAAAATAVATVALAVLTAILLQLNAATVSEMRKATEATARATAATEKAAKAAESEASATRESTMTLREQLEREWRPLLVLDHVPNLQLVEESGDRAVKVRLINLGRGPAVNVVICLWNEPAEEVWRSPLEHVGAGDDSEVSVKKTEEKRNDMFDRDPPRSHVAIICEDQAGAWHRFSRNNPVPDSYFGPLSRLEPWAEFYGTRLNRLPP